jgi:hypothetical protein
MIKLFEDFNEIDPYNEENWRESQYEPRRYKERLVNWLRRIGLNDDEIKGLFDLQEEYMTTIDKTEVYIKTKHYLDSLSDTIGLTPNQKQDFIHEIYYSLNRIYLKNSFNDLKNGKYMENPELFIESTHNEIDPYDEENWDEDKKHYAHCKRDVHTTNGLHWIFHSNRDYEIFKEDNQYIVMIGIVQGHPYKYVFAKYDFDIHFDRIVNESNEIDPYNEENWGEESWPKIKPQYAWKGHWLTKEEIIEIIRNDAEEFFDKNPNRNSYYRNGIMFLKGEFGLN